MPILVSESRTIGRELWAADDFLLCSYLEKHRLGRLCREVVAVRLGSRNVFLPDLAGYPDKLMAIGLFYDR